MIRNFSAGPCILPPQVLELAARDAKCHPELGLSVMEISHRTPFWYARLDEIEGKLRTLMNISDDYAVMFNQGGATMQFSMIPMNFAAEGERVDYIDTGRWALNASKEAAMLGRDVHIAGSSEATGFDRLPAPLTFSDNPAYVHYTSNNTVSGTEFQGPPVVGDRPLICDASSNILSKDIKLDEHALVYAGAQKNLGPAGVTLVIARRDILEKATWTVPTLMRYSNFARAVSMPNTPPVWSIHVMGLMLDWVIENGGVPEFEKRSAAKAKTLYDAIDGSDFYAARAQPGSRSRINICFNTPEAELDTKFHTEAEAAGLAMLKGHRSIGGMRASLYNGMPLEGVQELVSFMHTFERDNG